MTKRGTTRWTLSLLASALWLSPSAAQVMYGVGGTGNLALLTVDLTTGVGSEVNPGEVFTLGNTGTAMSCDGTLYGFSETDPTNGDLFTVDLTTGQLTNVQAFTPAPGAPPFGFGLGFAFDTDGTPLVITDGNLYWLDLTTGLAEHIGATGFFSHMNLAVGPDCALYGAGDDRGSWWLMTIDPLTATPTLLGTTQATMTSIEFAPGGRLFAAQLANFQEIDPNDGSLVAAIGPIGFTVPGLGYTPSQSCRVEPTADITALTGVCEGSSLTLDGSGSTACGPRGIEYRWLDGPAIPCDWSSSATCDVNPLTATTYDLEVRCLNAPGHCPATEQVTVEVVPLPVAEAGSGADVCEAEVVTLDASGSIAPGCGSVEYEWWDGAVQVSGPSPSPTYVPPTDTPGLRTYTVIVRCVAPATCEASDTVQVNVRLCALAVRFDRFEVELAERSGGDRAARLSFATVIEEGTRAFVVESAASPSGGFREVGRLRAYGPGHPYEWVGPYDPSSPWYRVVEATVAGRGMESPVLRVDAPGERAPRSRRGRILRRAR